MKTSEFFKNLPWLSAQFYNAKESEKISDALSDNFGTSGTIVQALGGYSKQQKEIVYFIKRYLFHIVI